MHHLPPKPHRGLTSESFNYKETKQSYQQRARKKYTNVDY
jgi:hypothetical protein